MIAIRSDLLKWMGDMCHFKVTKANCIYKCTPNTSQKLCVTNMHLDDIIRKPLSHFQRYNLKLLINYGI